MRGAPHLTVKATLGETVVEVNGEDASEGLRAMAITVQAGDTPRAMMEYSVMPDFEGVAQCQINVVNPLREVLSAVPLQRLRQEVDMAGMGEHPADVVLDVLLQMVDDLERERDTAGAEP